MRTCSKCGLDWADNLFVRAKTQSGYGSTCLTCDAARIRQRRRDPLVRAKNRESSLVYRRNHLAVAQAKDRSRSLARQSCIDGLKSKSCADCGSAYPPCCMDFDHVRGGKVAGIGEMLTWNKARVLAEVAKCDLVCACCHRLRTHPDRHNTSNPHRRRFYEKIDALKNRPCIDCGAVLPPVAMDFDHVRGEKVASIAQMRSQAWERVLVELTKCELVCANCHRVRTTDRKRAEAA